MSKIKYIVYLLFSVLLGACGQRSNNQNGSDFPLLFLSSQQKKILLLPEEIVNLTQPILIMCDSALQAMSKSGDTTKNDETFISFRNIFRDSIQSIESALSENSSFQKWVANTPNDSLQSAFSGTGFSLVWSEGNAYVSIAPRFLLGAFDQYLSSTMKRFLSIQQSNDEKRFMEDAALLISWDELSGRIATLDLFITDNPNFVALKEAIEEYNFYLKVYLNGIDNSPVFSFDDKTLDKTVKQSYRDYIIRYPATKSAKIVKGYLNILKLNNYKNTAAVQKYLKKEKVDSALGS